MPRPVQDTLAPWIESLILSYGSEDETSSEWLNAYVIGVGKMSQSQAQGSEGPTGLLFLSDGILQIPAILTASAWEDLQEQEDRECFTSLVNTIVCIQDYQLQFHMALKQTKCRFIISVRALNTLAVGPVTTPCSTILPSIKMKIFKTWRALLGQETQDSQKSECGFDLSELLGEWQHDCLQAVLEDVGERLMVAIDRPLSPQPSTSTHNPSSTHRDTSTSTSWGIDRVRYKGGKCFSVPIKCLLIPQDDAQQLPAPPDVGCGTTSGLSAASEDSERDLPQDCEPSQTTRPSVDDADWRIPGPAFVERDGDGNGNLPCPVEDSMLHEGMITAMFDSDIRPLSNPWDIFPPPGVTSSSSDTSPEATPTRVLHSPTATEFKLDHPVILSSTQLPTHCSKESHQTSEQSYLTPYQKLPLSTGSSTSVNPPEPFPPSTTDEHHADTAQEKLPALDQESPNLEKDKEETAEGKYRKAKRKRSELTPEALVEEHEEEAQINRSPPSWLFDTQAGSKAEDGCSHKQGQTVGTFSVKRPTAHSDGSVFYYSYQVSGQNLQDFSQFKVAEPLLQWAVKYLLVPKQTDDPSNTSGTSNQTSSDRTDITSL